MKPDITVFALISLLLFGHAAHADPKSAASGSRGTLNIVATVETVGYGAVTPITYGARFDGVADDTEAILSAIAAAKVSRKAVELPAGTTRVSRRLLFDYDGAVLRGQGRGNTIIKCSSDVGDVILVGKPSGLLLNAFLSGFQVEVAGAPAGTNGIRLSGAWRSRIDNVVVTRDFWNNSAPRSGSGIKLDTGISGGQGAFDIKMSNLWVTHFEKGITGSGTDLSSDALTNLVVSDSYISSNVNNISLTYAQGALVMGTQSELASEDGVVLSRCVDFTYIGAAIEASGGWGVDMDKDTAGVTISASLFNNKAGNIKWNNKGGQRLMGKDVTEFPHGLVRISGSTAKPGELQFFEDGIRDVRLTPEPGFAIGVRNGGTGETPFVFDVANKALGINGAYMSAGASPPVSGYWNKGTLMYNTSPAPGGYAGWVCVNDGSPGAWKGFGLIER